MEDITPKTNPINQPVQPINSPGTISPPPIQPTRTDIPNSAVNNRNNTPISTRQIRTLQSDIAELQGEDPNTHIDHLNEKLSTSPKSQISRPTFPEPQEITEKIKLPTIPTITTKPSNPFLNQEEQILKEKKDNETARLKIISPIRTYTSDVADAVKSGNTSIASIAIAENEKRIKNREESPDDTPSSKIGRNLLFIFLSMFLLGGGGFIVYYFGFIKLTKDNTQQVVSNGVNLISGDQTVQELIDSKTKDTLVHDIQTDLNNYQGRGGSVEIIDFVATQPATGTQAAQVKNISTQDFFANLELNAPDQLVRSFDHQFTFGVHRSISLTNQPFIIFTTSSYENTFAGMLNWENTITKDLKDIFFIRQDQVASSTASSTTTSIPIALEQYTFQDALIQNHDIRLVKNSSDQIILLYTFIDTHTLIITTNESTLTEAINRLIKGKFVR